MKYRYFGVAGPVMFFVVAFSLASFLPSYSSKTQMISELGATGAEYANIFNYLGFLPNGVFITAFAIFLYGALKGNKLNPTAAVLIAVHGMGMLLATWFSCDISCNPVNPSSSQIIHNAIAGIKFPALIVSMFVIGYQLAKSGISKRFGVYSIISGALSLVLMGLFASSVETRSHTGEFQRLFIGVAYLWLVLLSVNSGILFNGKNSSE